MIRAVLDTNVVISSIFWRGSPFMVVSMGMEKKYTVVTSPAIIDEVALKLKEKFNVPDDKINELLRILYAFSDVVVPRTKINLVRADKNDNKIIECAVEGGADYIVSGDVHLLDIKEYKDIKILTPSDMLKVLKHL